MDSGAAIERPLSGASKLGLIVGAGAITLVFYGFALVSVVLLLALIGVEVVLAVALARFGLISIVASALKAHLALLCLFFRSLWLRKSVEFAIELKPADAPGLFDMVERLSG